jgi:uncharacterized protein with LGFP repeats
MHGKLLAAIALAVAVLAAWVAAPALSLRPYQPGAVDFERALPQAKRVGADAVAAARRAEPEERPPRWASPPVEAPHRFDLVGVPGEMRELQIRVRDEGGRWSEWVEQADATPVYVDGANEAQVRAPFKPDGELHFVNVSGTAGGFADRLLHSARGSINSAFISAASAPVARAFAPKPAITGRAAWGADLPSGGCRPRGPAEYGSVNAAAVHHTVSANDYAPEEAAGIVLGICRFHVLGNGWNDIGYNALVDRYGTLYEGRAGGLQYPVVGAQAQGFNSQTTAIASVGDHSTEGPTPQAVQSIVNYLAWKLKVSRAVPATGMTQLTSSGGSQSKYAAGTVITVPRILGHLDLGLTACPGSLYAHLPAIRAAVQRLLGTRSKCSKPCRQCKRTGKRNSCERCRKCKRKQRARKALGPIGGEELRGRIGRRGA